ncbi:type VI secretion protein IcmF/TssM N-terminal domain-containing protein [Burkholderia pyrrocinia]
MLILRIVGLLAIVAFSWATALYFDWPQWCALAVLCGALAAWLLFRLARRAIRSARARGQLAQLAASEGLPVDRDTPERRLATRWRTTVDTLKRSTPRLPGRPLNALPWYIVIGHANTGKTTALARARVASPLRHARHDAPVEPTEDCDWWCFDDAVVLDLAGRYAQSDLADADRREWNTILDQLARFRKRDGLNGVVVTIDASRLVDGNRDVLTTEGCVIRERLEHLIRLFDKRFPVYVLVTQCDMIYGFDEWAAQLPTEDRECAFGYLGDHDPATFVAHAFDSINTRLRALRTMLIARGEQPSPRALLLPNELAHLERAFDVFACAAFGPNVYQETPYLRGLLFGSGRQAGGAHSLTLPNWLDAVPQRHADNAGLFLHDLFARVLPRDRDASRPVECASRWRLTTRRLWLAAWLLACTAAGLLMTVSFVGNTKTVDLIRHEYPVHPRFTGEPARDAVTLDKIGRVLAQVERRDDRWLIRWMATSTSVGKLEAQLRQRYVTRYRQSIEPFANRLFYGQADAVGNQNDAGDTVPPPIAERIRNLVRYVNLMQARQGGADRAALESMAAPTLVGTRRSVDNLSPLLDELTVSHIAWSAPGDGALAARVAAAQEQLDQLAYSDPNWSWLLDLPDAATSPDVTLADFWPATSVHNPLPALHDVRVPAALTAAHSPTIDAFLDDMAQAVANRPKFLSHRHVFDEWYRARRVDSWRDFVARFPQGEQLLTTEAQWRTTINSIPGRRDPFASLVARVDREFDAEREDALPPWLTFVRTTSRMLASAQTNATRGGIGAMLDSISRSGGQALRETLGGAPAQGRQTLERDAALRSALVGYEHDVAGLAVDALAGPGAAYRLSADFHGFGVDPSIGASRMHAAADALRDVKRLAGDLDVGGNLTWSLVGGPLHMVLTYVERQASCALQSDWERDVLWPLKRAATHDDSDDQLYGPQGSIWAFVDGPAKPFVRLGAARASVVETLDYRLPFTDAFLPMLDDAAARRVARQKREVEQQTRQQTAAAVDKHIALLGQQIDTLKAHSVHLGIFAQPTDVNPDAEAMPFETVLTLQCVPQAREMTNYNFPVSEQIDWRPDQCGDATLQIKIGRVTLVHRYPGPLGIARFVQDFRYGVRRFTPDDFPEVKQSLDGLGVRHIDVRYNFSGQDALLEMTARIDELEQTRNDEIARKQSLAIRPDDVEGGSSASPPSASFVRSASSGSASVPERICACWADPAPDGDDSPLPTSRDSN